jgi:hypothetical protein
VLPLLGSEYLDTSLSWQMTLGTFATRTMVGIGSLAPASTAAPGGASVTIRGSGFQSTTRATLGGKQAFVTLKDMNTLSIVTPTLSPGPQQLIQINPDGESLAFHAVFFAQ